MESTDLWTAVSRRIDGVLRDLPDGQRQTLLEYLAKAAWSSPGDSRAVTGLCNALRNHGLPVEEDALQAWLTAHFVEEAPPYFLLDRLKGLIPAQAQVAARRSAPAQKRNAAVSAFLTVVIAALAVVALAGFAFVHREPPEPSHATVQPSRQARETENLCDGVFYGYVSGDTHSPVEGASIVMTERGTGHVCSTVTNAKGQFEIAGLRRKSLYDVRVHAPGYMERNSVTDALPKEANNYMIILLNAPASVWGTVIDFERNPVSGAEVSLEQPRLTGDYRTYATTTTDANGRYRLDGVRIGRFWLHVTYEGLSVRGDTPIELTSGQVIDNVSVVLPSRKAKGHVSCPDPGTVSVLFVE